MSRRVSSSPPVSPVSGGQQMEAAQSISPANLAAKAALAVIGCEDDKGSSSEEYLSADEGYETADSDEGTAANDVPLRWLAACLKDELQPGKPTSLSVTGGKRVIKRHPLLLVPFYHALEGQNSYCLTAEAFFSIDSLFKLPIVRASDKKESGGLGASQLNTWQTSRIATVAGAKGLVLLCAAARAACGLSTERESIAGSIWQNECCRRVVLHAGKATLKAYRRKFLRNPYLRESAEKLAESAVLTKFLTGVLEDEHNQCSLEWIRLAARLELTA